MADNDLVFKQSPVGQPSGLLFGEVEHIADVDITLSATMPMLTVAIVTVPPVDVDIHATMPALSVQVSVATIVEAEIDAVLPGLSVTATAVYRSETSRPTVGRTISAWQEAVPTKTETKHKQQTTKRYRTNQLAVWQVAIKAPSFIESKQANRLKRTRSGVNGVYEAAVRRHTNVGSSYVNIPHGLRHSRTAQHQDATGVRASRVSVWQDMLHDRRASRVSKYREAKGVLQQLKRIWQPAAHQNLGRKSRYQEAIVPPPGIHNYVVIPPTEEPCYTPPAGHLVNLLFANTPGNTQLVFICERHTGPEEPGATVVVPIRSVYMTVNTATLKRVSGNIELPTYSMSLTIDTDSWTWSFSASLPASTQANLEPDNDGTPVELEAIINGVSYRVLAESLSRERTFPNATIRVSGRGKSALLAEPYAPVQSFTNTIDRTAQQLMADVLTDNGVPIGWSVDWQITDWLVPAGVWNHRSAYMDALTTIASAAGAYIQPHPTDATLRVLARYPTAPWDWSGVTPDFELPSSVTTREGIEWKSKPQYNRVFVSGASAGIVGQVTRTGTAGNLVAPMVTDALITEAPAARQRGLSILADTGRQAIVNLKLPVLSETGIITPGNFVRYVDGSDTKVGVVRSTSVAVGRPEIWQSIGLEVHV